MTEYDLQQYPLREYPQVNARCDWIFPKWSDTLLEDAYCDIKSY